MKEEILSIARLGCIGFHPAQLPNNKGRHPLIWALVLGLNQTASSFFQMQLEPDAGNVISQEIIRIDDKDNACTLYKRVMEVACEQVIDFSKDIQKNDCVKVLLKNQGGNVWRKRSQVDGIIDWRMSGWAIYNLIRALTKPYVGAEFIYKGKSVKIWNAELIYSKDMQNIEYGKVIEVVSKTEYYVKTYDNLIHVTDSEPVELVEGEYL